MCVVERRWKFEESVDIAKSAGDEEGESAKFEEEKELNLKDKKSSLKRWLLTRLG